MAIHASLYFDGRQRHSGGGERWPGVQVTDEARRNGDEMAASVRSSDAPSMSHGFLSAPPSLPSPNMDVDIDA